MSLVSIDKSFQIEEGRAVNFWEKNPQLAVLKPFSVLYDNDKSKEKASSSLLMWAIFFFCEPDEELNKFYRFGEVERKVEICDGLKLDDTIWSDVSVIHCIERYPFICLDAVGRTLKEYKDLLVRRASFLTTEKYDLESMTSIDNALAKNLKIYEDYDKIYNKFISGKDLGTKRGGKSKSLTESKQI